MKGIVSLYFTTEDKNMYCRFSIRHPNGYSKENPLTMEQYRAVWPFLRAGEFPDPDGPDFKIPNFYSTEIVVDPVELHAAGLEAHGWTITLERFSNNQYVGLDRKPETAWRNADPPTLEQAVSGNITHIHIPNIGLLMIDEVMLLEDCCTDALQRELGDGWRIIAVCPPNGSRRPDYIMGRTKEK